MIAYGGVFAPPLLFLITKGMASKKQKAQVFYRQLLVIEDTWNRRKEEKGVIFYAELFQYNTLIDNSSKALGVHICQYKVSSDCLNTSGIGNQFIYPNEALFQIKCLLQNLGVEYEILAPEISFLKDSFLKDKYSLYLFDRKQYTASDTLLSVTLEFEDRLRRKAGLSNDLTGVRLVNGALHPKTGILTLMNGNSQDFEGYYDTVRGFFNLIRGKYHHIKEEMGRSTLFKKIIFIDMLLDQFDDLIIKRNI